MTPGHAILITSLLAATTFGGDHVPQPLGSLRPMLRISWSRGPNLPQGVQDNDGGFIGDTLVAVGGYCSGSEEGDRRKPGRYPRGFLNQAWATEPGVVNSTWRLLEPFPGEPRQGVFAVVVDRTLYFWGGFSYSAPHTYSDGYALSRTGEKWMWQKMPQLPWPITSASAAVIGPKIYVLGGADYDGEKGFYTVTDRAGAQLGMGARLLMLDTRDLSAGWKRLPDCPGTPRFVHAFSAVNGTLYAIGGATGGAPTYTVVDNWRFDPAAGEWTRLRDLPISSGNFPKSSNLVYADRYILLPGGYQYGAIANPDGSTRENYGRPSQCDPASGLNNDVFVYDTKADLFGTADRMPIDNNLPMTVVRGSEIFLLGGETGGGFVDGEYYANHPDLLLRGRIEEAR